MNNPRVEKPAMLAIKSILTDKGITALFVGCQGTDLVFHCIHCQFKPFCFEDKIKTANEKKEGKKQ
jgi:hypothetical protein